MGGGLPAISGMELIQLLTDNGWVEHRRTNHGIMLKKKLSSRTVVTIVSPTTKPLPPGTLSAILGPKQTGLGRKGLLRLRERA